MDMKTALGILEAKAAEYGYSHLSLEACEALKEAYERGDLFRPVDVAWRLFACGMREMLSPI